MKEISVFRQTNSDHCRSANGRTYKVYFSVKIYEYSAHCYLNDEDLKVLVKFQFPRLHHLSLNFNSFSDRAL